MCLCCMSVLPTYLLDEVTLKAYSEMRLKVLLTRLSAACFAQEGSIITNKFAKACSLGTGFHLSGDQKPCPEQAQFSKVH